MFTRITLFLLANFGVLAVLSVSMRLLGVDAYLASQGGVFQLNGLLLMAAIMGFAGSFISLAMSKMMAKRSMRVQLIERGRKLAARGGSASGEPGRHRYARGRHFRIALDECVRYRHESQ
jgi:Zn-dependent protease with chaperone function